ncbi:MAG: TlpA disulfide reductase family protein [Gemmatimonadota bacterium]|nr:TlpA disulfide reductase family protein [Gemmatimonadota bacterium]
MPRPVHRRIVPFAGALVLFTLVACGGGEGEERARAEISDEARKPLVAMREAPEFELETLEGDSLALSDLSDERAILMNFWASWCAPCRAEIPDLIALHEDYEDEGFMVLGVTVNDLPRDSREFAEEMEMTYPSVIGTPAMLESYKLSPWLPITLLVKDGEVVREWVGPRTREEFEYPVRVALGEVPNLMDVVKPSAGARSSGAAERTDGARPARSGDEGADPEALPEGREPDDDR